MPNRFYPCFPGDGDDPDELLNLGRKRKLLRYRDKRSAQCAALIAPYGN